MEAFVHENNYLIRADIALLELTDRLDMNIYTPAYHTLENGLKAK